VVFRGENPTQDRVSVLRRRGFFVLIQVLRQANEPARAVASHDLLMTLVAYHLAMLGPAKHVPLALLAFLALFHDASLLLRPRSPLATPGFNPPKGILVFATDYTMHIEKMQLIAQAESSPSKPYHVSPTTDHRGSDLWCNFSPSCHWPARGISRWQAGHLAPSSLF